MSLPKLSAPAYDVRTWATNENYPSGVQPWSSQPIKVEHPSPAGGFVPGQGAGAPYFNRLFHDAYEQDREAKEAIAALVAAYNALVDHVGQIAALNWTSPASHSFNTSCVFYNAGDARWYLAGLGEESEIRSSGNQGRSWSTSSLIAGTTGSGGEEPGGADYTPGGDIIVSTLTRYNFMRLGGSWSKVDVFASAITGIATCCAYDPISGSFVSSIASSSEAPVVRTSGNGTSWTLRTPPFSFASANTVMRMHCRKDTGRIVWIRARGTNWDSSFSDDGGVTWSTAVNTFYSGGVGTPTEVAVCYNPTTDRWLAFFGETGTPSCLVYESDDNGESWTVKATLSASSLLGNSFAVMGRLWVALGTNGTDNFIVYSRDNGATWERTPETISTVAEGPMGVVGSTSGRLAAFYNASAVSITLASLTTGAPDLGVLT